MIKLLANENFPLASVKVLIEAGFDIISISEKHAGISDKQVMEIAQNEQRLIITFDSDYGELVFKYNYKPPHGVLYFRWIVFSPKDPGLYLIELLEEGQIVLSGHFTVIDKETVRQKKYIY